MRGTLPTRRPAIGAALMAFGVAFVIAGCSLSPLTNKIEVGSEPYVVLVGEGPDGQTDLFAGSAGGGEMVRITFSRHRESAPALDPTGSVVAFLRKTNSGDEPHLVFMNLVNASEREVLIPPELGRPDRLAWGADGGHIYLRTPDGVASASAPPSISKPTRIETQEMGAATRALAVEIGTPVIGQVGTCEAEGDVDGSLSALCVTSPGRAQTTLVTDARDPLRWGPDSVAYMVGVALEVRALRGGRVRRPVWTRMPQAPRQPTYSAGTK